MLKASEMLDIMCIEKEAGLSDMAKAVKNEGSALASDLKRVVGKEKLVPKNNAISGAVNGALAGAGVGAVGGAAADTGDNKGRAALRGAVMGAVGGGALGAGVGGKMGKMEIEAHKAQNASFKRGVGVGMAAIPTAKAVGKAGIETGKILKEKGVVDGIKTVGENVAEGAKDIAKVPVGLAMWPAFAHTVNKAYREAIGEPSKMDKIENGIKAGITKAKEQSKIKGKAFVDSAKAKAEQLKKDMTGHID